VSSGWGRRGQSHQRKTIGGREAHEDDENGGGRTLARSLKEVFATWFNCACTKARDVSSLNPILRDPRDVQNSCPRVDHCQRPCASSRRRVFDRISCRPAAARHRKTLNMPQTTSTHGIRMEESERPIGRLFGASTSAPSRHHHQQIVAAPRHLNWAWHMTKQK
jgi:hypothetical protein